MARLHPYNRERAAIATMHGKERVVAPILAQWFDLRVERAEGVDTDALGTFTGEIARQGTMLDAARAKARLAIERTGARFGLGSEGAFGPHPLAPIISSGLELMLLLDSRSNQEVVAQRRTRTNYESVFVSPGADLSGFLKRVGFPQHAVIVRTAEHQRGATVVKGVVDERVLRDAVHAMAARSASGRALVQTDMRAYLNPTRMQAIRHAAKTLALRMARLCPDCGVPGFGLVEIERGLPCAACAAPTDLLRAEIHACSVCGHREMKRQRPSTLRADPVWCGLCNP